MPYPASQMTLEALRSVPLFASLDDDAAKELRSLLREKVVPPNTALFNQGDKGNAMYLIESGRVRISIRDEDEHVIAREVVPRKRDDIELSFLLLEPYRIGNRLQRAARAVEMIQLADQQRQPWFIERAQRLASR